MTGIAFALPRKLRSERRAPTVHCELAWREVDALLAQLHGIPDEKRLAFHARIKHLQVRGFPEGTNTGSGKRARYTFSKLMQLVVAVELMQTGVVPQMTVKLVSGSWPGLRLSILSATYNRSEWQESLLGPNTDEWLWLLHPEALRELSVSGGARFGEIEALQPVRIEDLPGRMQSGLPLGAPGERHRTLVLYGTRITQAVLKLLEASHFATREQVRQDLLSETGGNSH